VTLTSTGRNDAEDFETEPECACLNLVTTTRAHPPGVPPEAGIRFPSKELIALFVRRLRAAPQGDEDAPPAERRAAVHGAARAANMPAMTRTWAFVAALALVAGCGGRQMLDPPATTGAAAGAAGAGGGNGNAGTFGAAGETGVAGASGAAGTAGVVGAPAPAVGLIDLTQAPPTFSMTCDNGVGSITFVNPCLVGWVAGGDQNPMSPGLHEVECTVATPAGNVGWSFEVMFPSLQNPQTILPLTPTASGVDLGNGQQARISMVTGALTFSRVDPTNRAFVARFIGSVTWTEPSGATFQCKMDTPVWGAPGSFI
jgi:hypothetical protein